MKKGQKEPVEIGWREWIALPDLDVPGIKVKVDTGARSSALHTASYHCVDLGEGNWKVYFDLHPLTTDPDCLNQCEEPVSYFREVKDSGGHIERRPFINTTVKLGPHEWSIDLSLTNREGMKFRMLLGRTAIREGFLVNPAKSYRLSRELKNHFQVK